MRTMKRRLRRDRDPYSFLPDPPLFRRLREHAMWDRQIAVRFYVLDPGPAKHHFVFCTEEVDGGGDPFVAVKCQESIGNGLTDPDAVIALAHELGHQESWLREDNSEDFEELLAFNATALLVDIPNVERKLVLEAYADECRAWKYGREILAAAVPEFDAWAAFDAEETEKLAGYRKGWSLSDAELTTALALV